MFRNRVWMAFANRFETTEQGRPTVKIWIYLFALQVAVAPIAATSKTRVRHIKPSHTNGAGKLLEGKAMHLHRVLRAVETVTAIATKYDREVEQGFFLHTVRMLSKREDRKLSITLNAFQDAEDLQTLAKCFDGLMSSCGEAGNGAFLDVFEEAYWHCVKQLSMNRSIAAGVYLKDLSLNRSGNEMFQIRKLIEEQAKRAKANPIRRFTQHRFQQ